MPSPSPSYLPRHLNPRTGASLVLTCEHATHAVPTSMGNLGLGDEHLRDHIGWDVGAAIVTEELSARLGVPAVLSPVSRLVVDCNRSTGVPDLMPEVSHGVVVPANLGIGDVERAARLREFYVPFHREVDRALQGSPRARLLSIHSFTPHYDDRDFDIGVLFDDHAHHADRLADNLRDAGFAVRMNEPYSGYDGLIFSAQIHGRRFDREYLELEINNQIIRDDDAARALAARIAGAVEHFIEAERGGG